MDYKKMAVDDLKKHEARKRSIISLKEKIQALESNKTSLGGMSDCEPVQTSGNKQEEKLINIISEQGRLKHQLQTVILLVRRMDRGLSNLNDFEYKALDRFYINPVKNCVDCLCEELGYEKAHIYRVKDKALYDLTIELYGTIEI